MQRGSKEPGPPLCESESGSVLSDSLWPHGLYSPWGSPGQNTGVGSLSLLQEVFPSQGSNPGLLYCRQILYQLSYKGSPPFPFPEALPNPEIELRSPALQADSLPAKPPGQPKSPGGGSLPLLQRIFPTQESNQGLLHCRWILY